MVVRTHLVPLRGIELNTNEVGGKALHLNHISEIGINVPTSWVVPASNYWTHLSVSGGESFIQEEFSQSNCDWQKIQNDICNTPLHTNLQLIVQQLCDFEAIDLFAVRSSATMEDGDNEYMTFPDGKAIMNDKKMLTLQ